MKNTGEIRKRTTAFKRIPVRWISRTWTGITKRIAFLSIFFAALIEFAIERARFDLWIVAKEPRFRSSSRCPRCGADRLPGSLPCGNRRPDPGPEGAKFTEPRAVLKFRGAI